MATSQNGWPVYTSSSHMVPFKWITGRVAPEVHSMFDKFCTRYNKEVEPIDVKSSWGYAYRTIRGSSIDYSNHASGTAIDLNAPKHPLGKVGTFSKAQRARIHSLLKDFPQLRWGGDYVGRKDEMHFEVNVVPSAFGKPVKPSSNSGKFEQGTFDVQTVLIRFGDYKGLHDGVPGPMYRTAVRNYQSRQNVYAKAGLVVDGSWGPETQAWFEWVKQYQSALSSFKGVHSMVCDGDYGSVTSNWTKYMQQRNGLYADGIAQVKTITFMRNSGATVKNRPF